MLSLVLLDKSLWFMQAVVLTIPQEQNAKDRMVKFEWKGNKFGCILI